jgi:hypothetical protein
MRQKTIPRRYRVYVVWAPSLEWGDGVGPAGYFRTKHEARRYLAELKKREKEEGQWGWRSVFECGRIEVWDARDLGFVPDEQTIDEFVEEMNSLL